VYGCHTYDVEVLRIQHLLPICIGACSTGARGKPLAPALIAAAARYQLDARMTSVRCIVGTTEILDPLTQHIPRNLIAGADESKSDDTRFVSGTFHSGVLSSQQTVTLKLNRDASEAPGSNTRTPQSSSPPSSRLTPLLACVTGSTAKYGRDAGLNIIKWRQLGEQSKSSRTPLCGQRM
jgi:hypothetical protein